jgi:uncharacterized protein (TIGR02677 family)
VQRYDVQRYDVQRYDVQRHDVQRHDVQRHDVQRHDVPLRAVRIGPDCRLPPVRCREGERQGGTTRGAEMLEHRRLPPELFRFTVGDRAEVYTAILRVFGEANERLETALGLDDLHSRLGRLGWVAALAETDLLLVLQQLRDWGLLDVTQNHAGTYRTAAEYERRNLQYSLTRYGEAALAGVDHAASVLAGTGALQTAVLDAIVDRLAELAQLVADPSSNDRRIFSALSELEGHLDGLRANTKAFNGQLQRLLRAEGVDLATFQEVKTATIAYLQEFLANLELRAQAIRQAVRAIDEQGVDLLHRRALSGADLPATPGNDPAPEWLHHRRSRWEGLQTWFDPRDGSQPRVGQLNDVARRAIVTLLQALDRINESRRRATSAAADLRELARWFQAAPSDGDLHRLWAVAFGLGSARHAHLVHPDPEVVPAGTSWAEAPPVPVSALLRSSGRTERFSRTGRVRDVSPVRSGRAERARQQRAELEAAWRQLSTGGRQIALADLGRLDHATFERLLELVGRALAAAPDRRGARRAQTADGQVAVELVEPRDGSRVTLVTPRGQLTGPNYRLRITSLLEAATRTPAVGERGREEVAG